MRAIATHLARALLGATLVTGAAAPLAAQDVEGRAAALTLGGRLNVQYASSSVDDAVDDVFLRRARIGIDGTFGEHLDGRIQVDVAGGEAAVKDAWARYALAPGLRITAGQFKRPFSIFELSSSTDLPIIERDGRIEGLSVCPGVGGPCTFSRLTERLEFDDRDLGVLLDGSLGERVAWYASVTNGTGADSPDENDGKSLSARVELALTEGVVLSTFGALHDYEAAEGETERAPAFGADVEVGTWRDGLHLLAAVARGENWEVPGEADFTTAQALATWYLPLEGRLAGVEPLLRVGWASVDGPEVAGPDPDHEGVLVTPGVMLYLSGKNGLSFNWDVYDAGPGDLEGSFKIQSFLYF